MSQPLAEFRQISSTHFLVKSEQKRHAYGHHLETVKKVEIAVSLFTAGYINQLCAKFNQNRSIRFRGKSEQKHVRERFRQTGQKLR